MAKAQQKTKKQELSVVAPTSSTAIAGMEKYKVVRQVTLPTFKLTVGIPFAFTANSAIHKGKTLSGKAGLDEDGNPRKPVDLLNVTNLDTGEVGQIVVGSVLGGNLAEQYPDDAYVGLSFAILKGEKKSGKRYHEYAIMEIEAA